jgi:hypothetical protein
LSPGEKCESNNGMVEIVSLSFWQALKPRNVAIFLALLCGTAVSHSQSPSDRVFLTERVPVRTHSGLIGFPPGTALHVISKSGDTSHVTDGTQTFDVSNNKLTTDAGLAARLAQNEYAAQEAAAQLSAQQMETYRQTQAAKRAEQERQAAALRQAQQQAEAQMQRQEEAAAQQQQQVQRRQTLMPQRSAHGAHRGYSSQRQRQIEEENTRIRNQRERESNEQQRRQAEDYKRRQHNAEQFEIENKREQARRQQEIKNDQAYERGRIQREKEERKIERSWSRDY